jgi:mRNA-degrading endonuclease RelE of RelBE toxin-antitoxin system
VNIVISKKCEKYLLSLPKRIAIDLLARINRLPGGDIKPFSGRKGEYRLRVGKFRILLYIEAETIKIFKIDTHGDLYK